MSKQNKKKRKAQNNARDFFTDYYKTNREYAKENEDRNKESGNKKWTAAEKAMLVIIILGVVGCFVKYVLLRG